MTENLLSMKEFPERMDRILTLASSDGKHENWQKSLSSNSLSWKGPQTIVSLSINYQCLIIVFTEFLAIIIFQYYYNVNTRIMGRVINWMLLCDK